MRIVDRREFLTLPEGTVYSFYESLGTIECLHVKYESYSNDWVFKDLISNVDCENSEELWNIMIKAERGEVEFHNDLNCVDRDGDCRKDQRFVVYDKNDVLKLIAALQETLDE